MRRLSIIDVHEGKQPIYNEDKSKVITFNGEIYNFQKLREALVAAGHKFTTHTDTEVILHGYEEYGTDILKEITWNVCIRNLRFQDKGTFWCA